MVRCRRHGADAIVTSREATSDSSFEPAVSVTGVVDALEEREDSRIRRGSGLETTAERLDGDVGVANDFPAFESLGRAVVSHIGIGEGTSFEIGDLHLDVEGGLFGDVFVRAGEGDDAGDHGCLGGDVAHDCEEDC